jgi:hypothetical protein
MLKGHPREPDMTISPDGKPYLYRWHILPRSQEVNVYFHVQVGDDPREELHDHPWDNTSVILAGGYEEILDPKPDPFRKPLNPMKFVRSKGDVIFRRSSWAHRLLMAGHPYTMTLFSTGPKIRDWGYWFPDGWHHNLRHNVLVDSVATFKEEM